MNDIFNKTFFQFSIAFLGVLGLSFGIAVIVATIEQQKAQQPAVVEAAHSL